jgi:ferredoxin-NADP reductase
VIYRDELAALEGVAVLHTLTRSAPAGWSGYTRRVDPRMLEEATFPASESPHVYVCGPTPFVEAVATSMVALGHAAERVKTERFGPTG